MWRSHDKTLVFVQRRIATCKRIAYRVMSTALVLREQPTGNWAVYVAGVAELRRMVLLSVASEHSKRNYAKHSMRSLRFARCDNSHSLALF
jgi:hypothetical protein